MSFDMRFCRSFLSWAISISGAVILHAQSLPNSTPLVAEVALPPVSSLLPDTAKTELPESPTPSVSKASAPENNQPPGATAWQPLTPGQRLILFWNNTYNSPGAFLALSAGSLVDQMRGAPAAWSDGNGYTRRFASNYGQLAARNVIHEGLAGATGLDPRYIPCNCKGTLHRSAHALKMTFMTYARDGRTTLDVPQIAGAYGSGMVSTYWYPHHSYSPFVQGVQFGHEEMGEVFVTNLVGEFSSDLKRALHLSAIGRVVR